MATAESGEQTAADDTPPAEENISKAGAPLIKRSSVRRQSLQQAGRYGCLCLSP